MAQPEETEPGGINVESIVAARNGHPYVMFTATQLRWQMTPDEARDWAQMILEACEAAEQDAFLIEFAIDTLGVEREVAAGLLSELRQARERWRERE